MGINAKGQRFADLFKLTPPLIFCFTTVSKLDLLSTRDKLLAFENYAKSKRLF